MANSNLFLGASLFEFHLFRLCKDIENVTSLHLKDVRGSGVSRLVKFLENAEFCPREAEFHEQVDAAVTLRNALLHAGGVLQLSRDHSKVRRIIDRKTYIEKERRNGNRIVDDDGRPEVALSDDDQRVEINNMFAFRATKYFRGFLLDIGKRVEMFARD